MRRRIAFSLELPHQTLELGARTLVMGILNVTPDSFSERGQYFDRKAAIARALEMEREGADLVDIGGESTRPGAEPVPAEEEIERTVPVIEALRRKGLRVPISIDTRKAAVAKRALAAGAQMVNDVSGLKFDPEMAPVIAEKRAGAVLMHMRGTPQTMQLLPPVKRIIPAIVAGLRGSLRRAHAAGIGKRRIVLDPGIGFGKTLEQNFEIVEGLPRLAALGYPILVGPSRKSFVRRTLEGFGAAARGKGEVSFEEVLFGTAAAVATAIWMGAHIVRVHDVRQMVAVARIADRLRGH